MTFHSSFRCDDVDPNVISNGYITTTRLLSHPHQCHQQIYIIINYFSRPPHRQHHHGHQRYQVIMPVVLRCVFAEWVMMLLSLQYRALHHHYPHHFYHCLHHHLYGIPLILF
jgi:hypothetical protein